MVHTIIWAARTRASRHLQVNRFDTTHVPRRTLSFLSRLLPNRTPPKKEVIYQDGRRIILTPEQKYISDKITQDRTSVFFTGSAGTGKSVLLREIIRRLRTIRDPEKVQVTASTGIAALNIGGTTLHSFAGIGLGELPIPDLLRRIMGTRSTYHRWLKTEVLIIDEISMVSAGLLDLIDRLAREVRRNRRPFGGIQLVVSGDFFQLPPVSDERNTNTGIELGCQFAFEANCWNEVFPHAYKLTKIFRQTDTVFIRLLNELRLGIATDETIKILNGLCRPVKCNDGILPTEIHPLRRSAQILDKYGKDRYGHPVRVSEAEVMLEKRAPKALILQVGAQVMCTQNIPESGLVNGSTGRVVDFITPEKALDQGYPIAGAAITISEDGTPQRPSIKQQFKRQLWPLVKFANSGVILMPPVDFVLDNGAGGMRASRRQVPLILAWALTIHRAQGQTIDRASVNLANTFAPGQAYVAISRCKTLEGLQILNFSPSSVFVDKK
ncbi:putative DNA helicase (PIF1) [Rhizoctonia solani 123E]|uniref:ATP-dependent DNA helicase n=1 Tax=Rhizoctonia solani 123E TaxID=1423351 RepID=A0A074S202_9AGAM|nr:putative DNA helicase (PIF1) [Rhizoctonia solani 123E]